MIDSLYIGATGMQAQQAQVDTISNNLANVNTTGYKKNRVSFEDLLYRIVARHNGAATGADAGTRIGLGAAVASSGKLFIDGELKQTGGMLDIALQGPGFLEVLRADGSTAYTRNGALRVNADGQLTTVDGHVLASNIHIPPDAGSITIDGTGRIAANMPGEARPVELGQLELAKFTNPGGLNPIGSNLLVPTDKSGEAIRGKAGDAGFGSITQGFLESSNVKLIDELVGLVIAQRAYEVNAKVIQASDEMLGISNNLRR